MGSQSKIGLQYSNMEDIKHLLHQRLLRSHIHISHLLKWNECGSKLCTEQWTSLYGSKLLVSVHWPCWNSVFNNCFLRRSFKCLIYSLHTQILTYCMYMILIQSNYCILTFKIYHRMDSHFELDSQTVRI